MNDAQAIVDSWPEAKRKAVNAWAKKRLAEMRLHQFVRQAWHAVEPGKEYEESWHILAICSHLEAVTRGEIKNLLINVPPGTMKSLLVCVFWPAWEWATHPEERFLCASYSGANTNPSMRDSARCRDLIRSEWYQGNWGLEIKDDQNAKGFYENVKGGWRIATSVGGVSTGLHPTRIIIDDPHKVREAESDVERAAVLDWWDGTMSTRGVILDVRRVCIMQRVHSQDLSGHLLDKNWTHLCLPMEYEQPEEKDVDGKKVMVPRMPVTPLGFQDPRTMDGELLWPKMFTPEIVAELKTDLGIYHSAAQLQQRPSPRGGGMFRREWFATMPVVPPLMRIVRFWDKAGTAGGTGAETAGCLMGEFLDATQPEPLNRKFIVLDVVHGRWEAADREAVILQTANADRAKYGHVDIWVEQEPGSGGKESAQGTVANLIGFSCQFERATGEKSVRAEPLAAQASVGRIKLLQGPWNAQFIEELTMFPVGKLKDFVDSCSGAFNKLAEPTGGIRSVSELRFGRRRDFQGAQ